MRYLLFAFLMMAYLNPLHAATLFAGLEGSAPPIQTTDLVNFPDVEWTSGFSMDVSGAAATPEGLLYICNGSFTTDLYQVQLGQGTPQEISTISVDIHGMGYGLGTLYGFSNYESPMGIYTIVPATGEAELLVSTSSQGYRFFAMDFNPMDSLLYGYTEYGVTGLYSIDPGTGEMIRVADPFPASNSSGRAMAIGNHTVYMLATRGDDGIDSYAYDLSQGYDGDWIPFTNPYPQYHSTGGAAFIADPPGPAGVSGTVQLEDGDGDVTEVIVAADQYTTHPEADGSYFLELPAGTWDIGATLDGYLADVVMDVEVTPGAVTENVDLTLVWDDQAVESGTIPGELHLFENYPNPFNPVTTVSFSIPTRDRVRLQVSTVTGRQIFELVNRVLDAGQHQVVFDGSELAGGLYLMRLEHRGEVRTGKMLLVK